MDWAWACPLYATFLTPCAFLSFLLARAMLSSSSRFLHLLFARIGLYNPCFVSGPSHRTPRANTLLFNLSLSYCSRPRTWTASDEIRTCRN
ncbi:hypothetical protein B0H14DRAFT_2661081 [Mycena olivaceomarginata]|nr:hypothetical protein B0H14DRAFT_2661081 [Mycena olivaceomarginata]